MCESLRSLFQQPAESSVAAKGSGGKGLSGIHKSGKELALEKKKDFEAQLGINISDADYALLIKEQFDPRIENSIIELADSVLAGGVVGNKSFLISQL